MNYPSQSPQPGVPLPQGPAPPPNRALWWVLGTIIALLLLVIGGGLYVASRVVRGISVQGPNQVEIRTLAGNVSIDKTSRNDTGLPVYPGAIPPREGAQIQLDPLHRDGGFGLTAAKYFTSTPLQTVARWYRHELDSSFEEKQGSGVIEDEGVVYVHHADLAFISHQEDRLRIVALAREGDRTKIALVNMGKKEPQ